MPDRPPRDETLDRPGGVLDIGGRVVVKPPKRSDVPKMKYTCTEYREEMLLLALRRQLSRNGLSEEEKKRISEEIRKLEAKMDMA